MQNPNSQTKPNLTSFKRTITDETNDKFNLEFGKKFETPDPNLESFDSCISEEDSFHHSAAMRLKIPQQLLIFTFKEGELGPNKLKIQKIVFPEGIFLGEVSA